MKILKSQINLKIVNNTALSQDVQILGIVASTASANGSNALYEFDLTGQDFTGVNSVTIEISNTSSPSVVSYTVAVNTPNIQGVVDALNTLGQGNFSYQGNIVYAPSSYYIYGDLTVGAPITGFVSNWNTTNTSGGSSTSTQVQLPLDSLGTYNFVVDWGDGNTDTITVWNQAETLHTYASSGAYTITIDGVCTGWNFNNNGDRLKLISVDSWGSLNLGNSGNNFWGCSNLDLSSVSDILDLTGTTDLSDCFNGCTSLTTINNVDSWDISLVQATANMFDGCTSFNQSLNSWDMGSVITMSSMFYNASVFNGNVSSWDVSSVTNINDMFYNCLAFNQSLNSWDVSSVLSMQGVFQNANLFNGDISSWNVSNVTNMISMFAGATSFNQNISSWDVSSVTDMSGMFFASIAFNQNIGSWAVSNVTDMSNFMVGKSDANYSATNLDSIYNGWSALTPALQPNVTANFGTIKYTVAGSAGKAILQGAPNLWTISDGGI